MEKLVRMMVIVCLSALMYWIDPMLGLGCLVGGIIVVSSKTNN